jgi:hypothetical protein
LIPAQAHLEETLVLDQKAILVCDFLPTHFGAQVRMWFSTRSPARGLPAVAEASIQI